MSKTGLLLVLGALALGIILSEKYAVPQLQKVLASLG